MKKLINTILAILAIPVVLEDKYNNLSDEDKYVVQYIGMGILSILYVCLLVWWYPTLKDTDSGVAYLMAPLFVYNSDKFIRVIAKAVELELRNKFKKK